MNRRDLLKQAGVTLLAASSVRASGLIDDETSEKERPQDLVVSFLGPFCYWPEKDYIKIMAPQVAGNFCFPHLPWVATTANEKRLQWCPETTYHYRLHGVTSRKATYSGTTMCSFDQDTCQKTPPPPEQCLTCPPIAVCPAGSLSTPNASTSPRLQHKTSTPGEEYPCCPALLEIRVPVPDLFVGINPTCAQFTPPRSDGPHYASAVTFLYKNKKKDPIDLRNIRLVSNDIPTGKFDFHADFKNDRGLPSASLRINLSALDRHDDPDHTHAKQVFFQMVKMFPWVDVQCIEFCAPAVTNGNDCSAVQVGPGDDCQAMGFLLNPPQTSKHKS